uniref:Uncharacterized protein LOC111105273 isoform X7 n=1 Tax=Crassostrea virginica TaxID=6565 RepID=A0A8B8AVF3_CRAVI|nr:uncharacterized protein LOC111105273 isoform X7 [Crassostrea virginica]
MVKFSNCGLYEDDTDIYSTCQDVVQSLTMLGDSFSHKKEVHVMRRGFQNVMPFISLQKRTDIKGAINWFTREKKPLVKRKIPQTLMKWNLDSSFCYRLWLCLYFAFPLYCRWSSTSYASRKMSLE